MGTGATTFTVMPCAASSLAQVISDAPKTSEASKKMTPTSMAAGTYDLFDDPIVSCW
jgi:hypothetical protein